MGPFYKYYNNEMTLCSGFEYPFKIFNLTAEGFFLHSEVFPING